jgi:protein HOOK3
MIDNAALKAREDLLLSQKKRILELEDELSKAQQHQAHESESSSNHRVVEIESRLTASANTIKLLEDKLKEKETNINQLRQEKGKLETYAKRSLDTFKEKYMSTLKIMQAEKKEMADKMKAVVEKYEKGQETWRREERLMSSALFEMGLKIMDRKIQLTLNDPSGGMGVQGQAYLAIQRDALNKAALDSATKATSSSNGGDSSAPSSAVKNPFTPAK